jgi:hypothetical protein
LPPVHLYRGDEQERAVGGSAEAVFSELRKSLHPVYSGSNISRA